MLMTSCSENRDNTSKKPHPAAVHEPVGAGRSSVNMFTVLHPRKNFQAAARVGR
jgi:hypothetical protein